MVDIFLSPGLFNIAITAIQNNKMFSKGGDSGFISGAVGRVGGFLHVLFRFKLIISFGSRCISCLMSCS